MRPLILTLLDDSELLVFVDDVESFTTGLKYTELVNHARTIQCIDKMLPLVNVDIVLIDGSCLRCAVEDKQDTEANVLVRYCRNITGQERLKVIAALEKELDRRLFSTYSVINNIPDLDQRAKLHEEYIKRKSAYVAVMEALIHGSFRT